MDMPQEESIIKGTVTPESHEMPTPSTPENEENDSQKKKKRWPWVLAAVIVVMLLVVVGPYWMVYQYRGSNSVKTWLKNTFPFPVAYADSEFIALQTLEDNITSAEYFFDQQEAYGFQAAEKPSSSELRTNELDHLIDYTLLKHIARDRGMTVADADIDTYFNDEILPQATGGEQEIEQTLQDLYGWSVSDFKKRVLEEVVLKQKFRESISSDAEIDAETKAKAQAVYEEIQQNSDTPFSDFALQYSDDAGTAQNGGSLGSFGKGIMVQEFEDAAFAMNVGDVSQPVKTEYGYHIITVTTKDDEAETREASHILIAFKSTEDFILERRDATRVMKFVPIYE